MHFYKRELLPGVFHISGGMDVCVTLLIGSRRALLFDTGYGLENLKEYIASITDKPLRVILSHGHHDHALGARHFDGVYLFDEERDIFKTYTDRRWREKVLVSARESGIIVDEEEYLDSAMPPLRSLHEDIISLGDLSAQVIHCPGHTPGSAVIYVPEHELLLTGDDWNPCTWLFFPEALPVREYRNNLMKLMNLPFRHVICSHRIALYDRAMTEDFARGLTDDVLNLAKEDSTGTDMGIRTGTASPAHDQVLVFDLDKYT